MSDRQVRLLELLERWREQGQPDDLEALCADCPDMREELEHLIRFQRGLEQQASAVSEAGGDRPSEVPPTAPPQGPVCEVLLTGPDIPDYEILGELGRGGMGVV